MPCFWSWWETFNLPPLRIMLAIGFLIYILYWNEKVPFFSWFVESFFLSRINDEFFQTLLLSLLSEHMFYSLAVSYYSELHWLISNGKPNLHSWKEKIYLIWCVGLLSMYGWVIFTKFSLRIFAFIFIRDNTNFLFL